VDHGAGRRWLGTILGAVNMITTVVCLRAPGMTMFRMPIFTWNIFVTSILVLLAFPILTAALLGLEADRRLGAHVFDPANGGAILWQHLFWFSGTPRSTSSRCHFSASCRRSSRCSTVNHYSVTRP
jgi:heme/copper-type cytochrome/quinol oxidase subunit 1